MDSLLKICKVYFLLVQLERQVVMPLDGSEIFSFPKNNFQGRRYSMSHGRDFRDARFPSG